jgi:hypothetical protein
MPSKTQLSVIANPGQPAPAEAGVGGKPFGLEQFDLELLDFARSPEFIDPSTLLSNVEA